MQTCPKMQYKIDFAPADLLCPKTLVWIPFARIKPYLDSQGGRALCDAAGALTGLGPDAIPLHRRRQSSEIKVFCSAWTLFLLPSDSIEICEVQDVGLLVKGDSLRCLLNSNLLAIAAWKTFICIR